MPNKKALPVVTYVDVKEKIGNGKSTILAFWMSLRYSCIAMSKL